LGVLWGCGFGAGLKELQDTKQGKGDLALGLKNRNPMTRRPGQMKVSC